MPVRQSEEKVTYLDWSLKLKQNRLRDENLTRLSAQVPNLLLQQLHLLPRPGTAHLEQSVYDGVEIDILLASHGRKSLCRSRHVYVGSMRVSYKSCLYALERGGRGKVVRDKERKEEASTCPSPRLLQ